MSDTSKDSGKRPSDERLIEADSLDAERLGKEIEEEGRKKREKARGGVGEQQKIDRAKSLGDILVEADLISAEELGQALEKRLKEGKRLRDILAEDEMVTAEQFATALSIKLNMPLIDLKRHTIQPRALNLVSEETARKHTLIPLDIIEDVLYVVMADPTDFYAIEDLQAEARMSVEPMLGVPEQIEQAIDLQYTTTGEIEKQISQFIPYELEPVEGPVDLETAVHSPIMQTFDVMVAKAIQDRASDIHIEPQETRSRIRYRIDGILHDAAILPISAHPALIARVKVMAGLDIAEQRRPQDGQITVKSGGRFVDIRVATSGTSHGERATLRLLDKEQTFIELENLGFSDDSLKKYSEFLKSAYGMVLMSGPTGSGKTTTLYASISQLDRDSYNVMTVEDPIEYQFTNLTQVQVNLKAGITFTTCLRTFLRHDPDIMMVGEIRDGETANLAAQAAMTGHLLFSSIHANDSVSTIFRLVDLGVEPYLIAATLLGVVAQRMVRRVCPHCRIAFEPSPEEREAY
ncbi:MAG: GspE/PulE family protein, partial [Dehalococcoidia bacterium]